MYLGGELDSVTWTGNSLPLPGLTLWASFKQKLNEFAAFEAEKTAYNTLRTQFNNELNIYSRRGFDLFGTFPWLFGESTDERTVEMIMSTSPNKPTRPAAYDGVKWADVTATSAVGMGNLAAGELALESGGKSFGVLGQGNGDTANGFT